jgi:DNA-binding MarR family transcriptional regulator
MEYYGNEISVDPEASGSVQKEIIGFFKDHPFLLVSESRLACLLCRPPSMVSEAVRALEEAGLLLRRNGEILLGVEDNLARVEI